MTPDDIEQRIRRAKAKREKLVSERAEKLARQKAAQEKLKKLKDRAEANGFDLEDIDQILADKRGELEAKLTEFEETLSELETSLATYDN